MSDTSAAPASSTPSTPHRRRRWLRRLTVLAVVLLVCYTLAGFFGTPLLIKHVVAPRISEGLTGEVNIGGAAFNPFTFDLVLRDVQITDASAAPVVGFARFDGNLKLFSTIIRRGFWFGHALLLEPVVEAEFDDGGALNLASLRAPANGPQASKEPLQTIPRIVINDLRVTNASAKVRDLRFDPPVERAIADLNFEVSVLDTEPTHDNPHSLDARLGDGASLSWSGTTFVNPLTTTGTIVLEGLDLAPFAPYGNRYANLQLRRGTLSFEVDYSIAPVRSGNRLVLDTKQLTLRDVGIAAEGRPVVELGLLELTGVTGDADTREVRVERVRIEGFDATVRREQDGELEVLRLTTAALDGAGGAASDAGRTSAAEPARRRDLDDIEPPLERLLTGLRYLVEDASAAWSLQVEGVEFDGATVRFEDNAARRPVELVATEVEFRAGPISSEDGFRTPLSIRAAVQQGTVQVTGEIDPAQSTLGLAIDATGLDAATIAPYLPPDLPEPFAGVELASATVDVTGRLDATVDAARAATTWEGVLTVAGLETTRDGGAGPVGLDTLTVDGRLEGSSAIESGAIDSTWRGTVELAGARAEATIKGQRLAGSVERVGTDGELVLALGGDAPVISWNGTVGIIGADASSALRDHEVALAVQRAETTGELELALSDSPDATWRGSATVEGLTSRTDTPAQAAVELGAARVDGASVTWSASQRTIEAELLELTAPRLEAIVEAREQGSRGDAAGATDSAADAPATDTLPTIRLGALVVRDGAFDLESRLPEQTIAIAGTGLQIRVENIDTQGGTPSTVDVSTQVADVGVVGVRGDVDPFRELPFVDLDITLTDVPLRPFSSAAEPQLGYVIDSGRLTLTLPLRMEAGRLDADLEASLHDFYLGAKVPSETAPNLPIKLGLDLLRDGNDVISADIGISGDTTDPEFSYGGIVWKAVTNLIAGVATSPFRLIGGLVDGGDDADLSQVAFEPGVSELAEGSAKNLDVLARALQKRPRLRLGIVGVTGPEDEAALRSAELERLVGERTAASGSSEEQALAALLGERLPDAFGSSVPVPPGRIGQTTPPPDEMRRRLLETIDVPATALVALRQERAEAVLAVLTQAGGLDADRARIVAFDAAEQAREIEAAPIAAFELLPGE